MDDIRPALPELSPETDNINWKIAAPPEYFFNRKIFRQKIQLVISVGHQGYVATTFPESPGQAITVMGQTLLPV